jgi:ADP-dependent NAD(P)H-hydrate dehydratase / NAD(P)H-hydrate epimerase
VRAVLSAAEMRAFDAGASAQGQVPGLVLMENAGRGAADVIERHVLRGALSEASVVIVAGPGNNGGDGFVVARHLALRGAVVSLFFFGDAEHQGPDAKAQRLAWENTGGVTCGADLGALHRSLRGADVVVDGLFGIGLGRLIAGAAADAIALINGVSCPRVSLDVPSGLDADTGVATGPHVRATHTVTFAFHKRGLVTGHGRRCAGEVSVADIGVPVSLLDACAVHLLDEADVRATLAPRDASAHKYDAGHVLVLGGSPGKAGAALLAARAALRAGAGLVTLASWPQTLVALPSAFPELMQASVEQPSDLLALLAKKRAIVAGPGLGTDARAAQVVAALLETYDGTIVLDADGLAPYAGRPEALRATKASANASLLLTPHAGELGRLLGVSAEAVEGDRFGSVLRAAERTGAAVLLKGPGTLVAAPNGRCTVIPTGNPALAVAGSGDVLAGIIGALACTMNALDAASVGAWVHGATGDTWAKAHGDRGLLASELAEGLPATLRALGASASR